MYSNISLGVIVLLLVSGCGTPASPAGTQGSRSTHHLRQPPEKAARCFAHNAEEHSSALLSEVRTGPDTAHVIVRVKNGVTYATADFERAGSGSNATIVLNVTTSGRQTDL